MKIKKFIILFVVLMLSAISVFAQKGSTVSYSIADETYGVLYDGHRNIVGYRSYIVPQIILIGQNHREHCL